MSRDDDDLLERATRALRATPPPTRGELSGGKERLLAAQRALPRPTPNDRARTLRWILPLAAVLAAGTALAAVPGNLERVAEAVQALIVPQEKRVAHRPSVKKLPPPAVHAPAPIVQAPALPIAPAPAAAEPIAAQPAVQATAARPLAHKPRAVREAPHVPAAVREPLMPPAPPAPPEPVAEPQEPTLAPSADLAKYRVAHKAHFQQRDFALALRLWEAYLRQFPNGTFSLEARYNRAICLLRSNRKDEARRALEPFARGELGNGYRKAEATKLLEALE